MKLPDLGEVFEGRYELLDLLGEGGFARVYRARDVSVGRAVALKVLSPTGGKYREITAARFMREVRLIGELQDPHTITLFDFGQTDDGLLFMACEYVPGQDLQKVLDAVGRLPAHVVSHILSQVLQSLREAHRHQIMHRDIKPANILVYEYEGDRYRTKLLDFGLAKSTDVDGTAITRQGLTAGTPRYMSPEQVLGQGVGPPSDIYSLGLVAYELLTGEPAVDADDRKELLRAHVTGPPIVLADGAAPPALRAVVQRMCARSLEDRYADAEEVLADLQRGRAVVPVSDDAETRPHRPLADRLEAREQRQPDPPSRTTIGVALGAVGIVVFVLVALALPTPERTEPDEVVLPPSLRVVPAAPVESPPTPAADIGLGADDGAVDVSVAEPASGCGVERDNNTTIKQWFEAWGTEHRVAVRVPYGYDASRPYPVIVMFRGRQLRRFLKPDDADDFFTSSGLRRPANQRGYVLASVQPEDPVTPWEAPVDGEYVDALMAAIKAAVCLDEDRIYVMGHDRGAEQAHRLACFHPVSAVSLWHDMQRVDDKRCDPHPQVPMLHIWGRKDRDVGSHDRGSNCDPTSPIYIGHVATSDQWRVRNDCSKTGSRPWRSRAEQVGGSCTMHGCGVAFVECKLEAGRQFPFPTNSGFPVCQRERTVFDHAGNTLAFFEKHGRKASR